MNAGSILQILRANAFVLTLAVALFVVLAKAITLGAGMHENFAKMGNDDIMRLNMVRDLIAGQGWFDTTQYRMVPPDGLSMHWSRYIDAGIAAVIVPLSWVMPMDTAEMVGATVWPTLIMVLVVCIVGFGTRRIFGPIAACFALLCLVFWPLTADLHMRPGNLDHHNVQLLLMFLLLFAVVWPARPVVAGIIAGLSSAFSLAIGLESLLFIVVAGLIFVVRAALAQRRQTLFTFAISLGLGSILFWLGQAPPATRFMPVCDQLGTPILGLVWTAVIASILPAFILRGPLQIAATAVLAMIGLAIAWPLLGPCLAGPYGDLPQVLQDYISTRITEAKPAIAYAIGQPVAAVVFLTPIFAALVFGGALWLKERDRALGLLMVFCLFGTAIIFYQMRTFNMVAAVVPLVGGVVMARLLAGYLASRDATVAVTLLAALLLFMGSTTVAGFVRPFLPQAPATGFATAGDCRTYASLVRLNAVPPARILAHGNFGASILWATHHDALAGPYHRSAQSLGNGILPFEMESDEMAAYVRASGATHLLMCRGYVYEGDFANALATGSGADWLARVALADEAQILYEVLPQ